MTGHCKKKFLRNYYLILLQFNSVLNAHWLNSSSAFIWNQILSVETLCFILWELYNLSSFTANKWLHNFITLHEKSFSVPCLLIWFFILLGNFFLLCSLANVKYLPSRTKTGILIENHFFQIELHLLLSMFKFRTELTHGGNKWGSKWRLWQSPFKSGLQRLSGIFVNFPIFSYPSNKQTSKQNPIKNPHRTIH